LVEPQGSDGAGNGDAHRARTALSQDPGAPLPQVSAVSDGGRARRIGLGHDRGDADGRLLVGRGLTTARSRARAPYLCPRAFLSDGMDSSRDLNGIVCQVALRPRLPWKEEPDEFYDDRGGRSPDGVRGRGVRAPGAGAGAASVLAGAVSSVS